MSDQIEVLFEEGRALLGRGQAGAACERFCRLLEVCPQALDDVATAFGHPADRLRALELLESKASGRVSDGPIFALAARLARDLDRLEVALDHARRAVELAPSCPTWWFELGEINLAARQWTAASAAYRRCLELDGGDMLARSRLGWCRRRRWSRTARLLSHLPGVRRLLRRLAWSHGRLLLLEAEGDSVAAHQMRWVSALEYGSAMSLFPLTPEGMEPENFARHYEQCECFFWHWFLAQGIESEIRTVLDVGAGSGYVTEHFVRRGFDVTGVTCNPSEKSECERRGIKVVEEDFHFLPAPDDSFDLVFSSHSLEHSVSPLFALWEWKRVVRPGGYVFIAVPLPIEQDARAALADHYDAESDAIDFSKTLGDRLTSETLRLACYPYGAAPHTFTLNYWQLRWLFQLVGLELVAACAEDARMGRKVGLEHVDGRLVCDPTMAVNGLFLLRKPHDETADTGSHPGEPAGRSDG